MTADGVVLVHGGMHGSWCWSRVLPRLELPAVAVDLPRDAGLDGWADTVAGAASGMRAAVVVAHSLAGIVALEALARAGDRIHGAMFVAAVVPRDGQSYFGTLPAPLNRLRELLGVGRRGDIVMPAALARLLLCHDLPPDDARTLVGNLTPEPVSVLNTPVRHRLPDGARLAYVHTTRDRAVSRRAQELYAARLHPAADRLYLDCGHSAFFSRPHELAALVNTWCAGRPGLTPDGCG
ncbi:alpha/beta fold hydrolase [Nonomuraea sp. NPDC050547]|uniref:alpha/beta fold hydrolase n=1 Tax=Nonomuraea sp. NPDC050547 TaxID=3364368 RepID=UPI0037A9D6D0